MDLLRLANQPQSERPVCNSGRHAEPQKFYHAPTECAQFASISCVKLRDFLCPYNYFTYMSSSCVLSVLLSVLVLLEVGGG